MKPRILLASALLALAGLAACSKKSGAPTASAPSALTNGPSAAQVFAQTTAYDEKTVVQAAASLARAGQALGTSAARACWEAEEARGAVREACFLAWAIQAPSDTKFFFDLCAAIPKNPLLLRRNIAIACVRAGFPFAQYSAEELFVMLAPLQKDPPWLRALPVLAWLREHSAQNPAEAAHLWEAVQGGEGAVAGADLGPASLAKAYAVAVKLGSSYAQEMLSNYCDPSLTGLAQGRCWRFLSTLVNPRTSQALDEQQLPFLPQQRDAGWRHFERNFPERASLLRRYF